jgi:hypothetical protein
VLDPPGPRPAAEVALLEEVRAFARSNLELLSEAGRHLDDEYSVPGIRARRARELRDLRGRRGQRLRRCIELRTACPPGDERRQQRRNLPGAFRPGAYRRKLRGSAGFLWKPASGGTLPSLPFVRLGKAITEVTSSLDHDMVVEQAQLVVLLAWLTSDRAAHQVSPTACALQRVPWDPWSTVDGEDYQGRALCEPQLDALIPWLPTALGILQSIREIAPPGPASAPGREFARIQPPAEAREIEHAADFSWLLVRGQRYTFTSRQQARVIAALYESWKASGERDGSALRAATLGAAADFNGARFRIEHVFANHPALGKILRRTGKGTWALFLRADPTAESP